MRKRKILRFFGIALCVILGVLVILSITGTVAYAAGLVDNTVSVRKAMLSARFIFRIKA